MLVKIITSIISNFIMVAALMYTWYYLQNKQIDIKNKKIYISIFVIMIYTLFNYFFMDKYIRILTITLILIIFYRFLFKEKINKCIITPIFYQIIMIISEMLFVLLLSLLKFDINSTMTSSIINMIANIIITIISIIITRLKITKKTYNSFLNYTDKINFIQLVFFSLLVMLNTNILIMSSYHNIKFIYMFIYNIIISSICFFIVMYSFRVQNNFNKVYDKYNVAVKSLNNYESMMVKYKIANHENKNLLLSVRTMIDNKEKGIPQYIDSIIENKYSYDEKLFFELCVIPSGGLRAMIYTELVKIKENKINYFLNIDKKLKTIDLLKLDSKTTVDICKIISVYIDNAIEEVLKLRKKYISIELYLEDEEIKIKISNNYKQPLLIDRICDEGYTTKGEGHGYGLPLTLKLINDNSIFSNQTQISKTLFSQVLSIKYKKTH